MAKIKRLFLSFYRLFLPVVIVLVLALVSGSVWLVHESSQPPIAKYLVTPDKYGMLSSRGAQITEETWQNQDGTAARGWLLRGAEGYPAVILFHKYGADRSHVLNLGVKLNEATNFTVLMPDQRGHGEAPPVMYSTFGSRESLDAATAIGFVRNLKTPMDTPLVGSGIGLYGIEMGATAALSAAAADRNVKTLVIDSVPQDTDAVLSSAIDKRHPFASFVTTKFAAMGTGVYYYDGSYEENPACGQAKSVSGARVLLLAGPDAPDFRESTSKISKCFPAGTPIEAQLDMSPSGYNIMNASIERSEAYDQKVVDFFKGLTN